MSNQRERDLFEEAYCRIQMIDEGSRGDVFDKYPDGRYIRHSLGISWLMWQASANRDDLMIKHDTLDLEPSDIPHGTIVLEK